jgi:serine/threonine protein kinase
VSKLLKVNHANEEMLEINNVKQALRSLSENQKKYFSVFNVTECSPELITDPSDFENVLQKCEHIVDEDDIEEFNDYINDYKIINMPNYGDDLSHLVKNITTNEDLYVINNLVRNLITKAIIPMNKLNVLHRDVKDVNIMFNKQNLVLIDWGFCVIGKNKTELPKSIVDDYKPLMYNTPFSSLLLRCKNSRDNISFPDWFKKKATENNGDFLKTIVEYFYKEYYPLWSRKGKDHFSWINHYIPKVFNNYSFPTEIVYLNRRVNNIAVSLIIHYINNSNSSNRSF